MSNTISTWLKNPEVEGRISAALGGWMSRDEFISQLEISFQDTKLAECTRESLFKAAHECAALQLLPTLNQVALIERNNTVQVPGPNGGMVSKKQKECTVMPQWQGYKALMERNPEIMDVTAHLVHVNDEYKMVNRHIHHNPDPFDETRSFNKFADVKGGYCVIQYNNRNRPDKHFFVTVTHMIKAKKCAMTTKMWDAWFYEMCLKTVYRKCFSARAVQVDPAVAKRIEDLTAADDKYHQNDPINAKVIEVTKPKRAAITATERLRELQEEDEADLQDSPVVEGEKLPAEPSEPSEPESEQEPHDKAPLTEAEVRAIYKAENTPDGLMKARDGLEGQTDNQLRHNLYQEYYEALPDKIGS